MSAVSVRPRSSADCLIRSAVDISYPRQQENPIASVVDGPVCSDIINGLGAGTVGGGGNPSLVSSMPPGVVSGPVDSASAPPAKFSALHPGSQLLSTLISLLALSTSTTTSLALHLSLHSPPSPLPSPLLLLLLLLGNPSEIQEFSLSLWSSFSPIGGCLIINFSMPVPPILVY